MRILRVFSTSQANALVFVRNNLVMAGLVPAIHD
jgi:hypothetical protein